MAPDVLASRLGAHPVAAFVGLTLLWSWGVWSLLLGLVGRGGLLHDPPPIAFAIAAAGGLGPSLVGCVLTGVIDGRAGLAALRSRCRRPAAGAWWLALLIIPAVTALTPLCRWALTGSAPDGAAMLRLLGPGLAMGLAAGLAEEFGWRGFLLPRLRQRHSPWRATLFVGLVWGGLWHGFADYFGLPGEGWVLALLIVLLGPLMLTAWSLVMTVVFERSQGSLVLAVLMHTSISSSALVLGPAYDTPQAMLGWSAFGVALAWGAAFVLWAVAGPLRQRARS